MSIGDSAIPTPAPPAPPEWVPHPNGRPHFWLSTKTGLPKYAPPSPYGEPPAPPAKAMPSGNPEMDSNTSD